MPEFERHHESSAVIAAPVDAVFAYVDDPARLSSHMEKSSWAMGGGAMNLDVDEQRGRKVGSRIRFAGHAFGIPLELNEIVTERDAPRRKVWQTTGSPKLLVIGPYRMGFEVAPRGDGCTLRVFIDYRLPEACGERWLGRVFGPLYAKWCTQRMVHDTALHFGA